MISSESRPDATVRPARCDDEDAVWPLAQQLATSYVPERSAFARTFDRILSDPAATVLVVEVEGSLVVGYVHVLVHPAFHANGDIAWVEELVVDSAHRGRGVGRVLMQGAERWAVETAQAAHLSLATRRAAGFYLSIGYEESAGYFKRRLASSPSSGPASSDRLDG